jgi:hypothetical protein
VFKIILKTLVGLILTILGFCLGFYYLIEMERGCSVLVLIPAALLIVFGFILLMRAGKSDATVIKKLDIPVVSGDGSEEELKAVFSKNNQLSSRWAKTVENRDKLKLLQISSAAEEQSE